MGPSAKAPLSPIMASPSLGLQHYSVGLTVNPDRSVGVGFNTSQTFPPQNATSVLTPGYAIHSSSSFSQQSNAVVQTSTVRYQLPPFAVNIVNSITLTASQAGLTGQGSLTITTNVPTSTISVTYSTTPTKVQANAAATLYFSQTFFAGTFLANQTAFQKQWASTFANTTWTSMIKSQIQNATKGVTVTTFAGTVTYPSTSSASVSISFVAQPTLSTADFVTVFENALTSGTTLPSTLDSIVRSAVNLETGESLTLSYSSSTNTIVLQSTTNYVSDLDARINSLKNQLFQFVFSLAPAGTVYPASILFLNSTSVTVSGISTTSDLDLSAGTSQMTFKGLVIRPPTADSNTNFTIPKLFQLLGGVPAPKVNITLIGGSNSTYQVKIVVPAGTPAPSSMTANSDTWTNLQNSTMLQAVRFTLVRLPASLLDILLSPIGIAVWAIAAAAIAAGVILYIRRRRATLQVPVTSPGPTPAPGLGPSP